MYTCSCLLPTTVLQVVFLFIVFFMAECKGKHNSTPAADKNDCPFIETLSFGSEINIRCNSSHLLFNEMNGGKFNWKFANQTAICKQNGTQQAHVSQCDVKRLGLNYLYVPLVSATLREKACVYCRINYKPIAPLISVIQSEHAQYTLYTVNITATGLAHNESFEILWAKRANDQIRYSYNYWFLRKCVHHSVKILENTGHTILFAVDDSVLSRVEFIIRRCGKICRNYDKCHEDQFNKEIILDYLPTPDSIEKLSCDSDCLTGLTSIPQPTQTYLSARVSSSALPTMHTPSNEVSKTIVIIVLSISGLVLTIPLVILLIYLLCKRRKRNMYAKTSNVDSDETK